jgi:lipid-A-disaccharide synthase
VTERLRERLGGASPMVALMPGSRMTEIARLAAPFGAAAAHLRADLPGLGVIVPALKHTSAKVAEALADFDIRPVVVTDEAERHAAMVMADAALVASGTATLELALAATPMVVGYRMEATTSFLRRFLPVHSIVLANLILGGDPVPELFQGACTPADLAAHVGPLLRATTARHRQLAALAAIAAELRAVGKAPSAAAADIVMEAAAGRRPALLPPND